MLDDSKFSIAVDSLPLSSIDILLKKNNKFLLGKRIDKTAKDYFFSPGGRVFKNENIKKAITRIAKSVLNIDLTHDPNFTGVFEHFYSESIYDNISSDYINLAYEYEIEEVKGYPNKQHYEYKWFTISELLISNQVHKYVKNYFRNYS